MTETHYVTSLGTAVDTVDIPGIRHVEQTSMDCYRVMTKDQLLFDQPECSNHVKYTISKGIIFIQYMIRQYTTDNDFLGYYVCSTICVEKAA